MVIAELRNVTKRYGAVTALSNVDLSIERGQLLALLGPNGAGKTTAVRLLLGLAKPASGTVRVFGQDPLESGARVRTGVMLQVGRVPDTLRVREHVALFSSYYPKPLPMTETMKLAGLEGLEGRLFHQLSGGQKQRVLFALAICGNPDLLVLDEPTTGLDVESRRTMWRHIRSFISQGRSVLLTTHYLEEADALADRIVVIDHGRTIAQGTTSEIKKRGASKTIRCVTSVADWEIAAMPGVASFRRDGVTAEIVTSNAERVLAQLFTQDPELSDLEVKGAGLEEAFLAITNQQPVEEAVR